MLMADMTWHEVKKHISEVNDNLIIPVATCEQHGNHLPLGNDTFIAEYMADILSERTKALVAPTINYGVNLPCDVHLAGTTSIKPETLREMIVKLYVGPYLKNVQVKHGAEPMSEDHYEYNPATGYLTIHTSSFSEFEVTFENMQAEVDKYCVIYAENGTILLSARDLPDDVTEYAVRPGVKMIFPYAFAYKLNLTRVTLPESLEEIGDYAFNECKSLAAVNLGEATNLKKIGNRAFRYCFSLTTLALPPALTEIGPAAFMGCVTLEGPLTIPASVTKIEDQTFEGCYKLKGINLSEGITYIGKNAFKSCESITELTIPASVTYCGNQFIAFERLVDDEGKKVTYSLEKVTFLGENLPELGISIFLHASRPANDGKQLTIYVKTEDAKVKMENYLASGNITSAPADKWPEVKIIGQE